MQGKTCLNKYHKCPEILSVKRYVFYFSVFNKMDILSLGFTCSFTRLADIIRSPALKIIH